MIPNVVRKDKPLPRTRREKYDGSLRFSGHPSRWNRAEHIKRSNDTFKGLSVGIEDADRTVINYFQGVIKPTVRENGVLIDVPVKYATSELWRDVQLLGYMRDKKGTVVAPHIILRRTSISRNDEIPIDKANRNILHQFPLKWSNKNSYDRFSLLNGVNRKRTYEMYSMIVPDHVVVEYEFLIVTSFIEQMNTITEKIFVNEGQYWGEENNFKFYTKIDSISQNVDITTDKGRLVKSNFNLTLKAYLIPEYFNEYPSVQKRFTTQEIKLGVETTLSELELFKQIKNKVNNDIYTRPAPTPSADEALVLIYLLQDKWKKATSVVSDNGSGYSVVTFANVTSTTAPSGVRVTSAEDYLFFVNGLYIEHDAFTIEQSGVNFKLNVNIALVGYEIESTDEVLAWGFFE